MKELQNMIRNKISTSYKLRDLEKNDKISREKVNEIYAEAKKHDEKIKFLKNLSNALKEEQNENKTNNRRY